MKLRLHFLSILFSIPLISFGQLGADLDNTKGTSMIPILSEADTVVGIFESAGYEITHLEFNDLSQVISFERKLTEGTEWGIFVFGDYKFKLLSMKVYKQDSPDNWTYTSNGNQDGRTVSIFIRPENTMVYKFEVRADEFYNGHTSGHVGLIIFHR